MNNEPMYEEEFEAFLNIDNPKNYEDK